MKFDFCKFEKTLEVSTERIKKKLSKVFSFEKQDCSFTIKVMINSIFRSLIS